MAVNAAESPDYLAVKAAFDGSSSAVVDAKKLKKSVDNYQNVVPTLTTNNEVRTYLASLARGQSFNKRQRQYKHHVHGYARSTRWVYGAFWRW